MTTVWEVAAAQAAHSLATQPVEALVLLVDVPNSDHLLSVIRAARESAPTVRLLMICSSVDQSGIVADITGTLGPLRHRPDGHGGGALSARQRRVLADIRAGMTNREIAGALGVSLSTVNRHVEHILAKLGVRNRAQAAAFEFDVAELKPN